MSNPNGIARLDHAASGVVEGYYITIPNDAVMRLRCRMTPAMREKMRNNWLTVAVTRDVVMVRDGLGHVIDHTLPWVMELVWEFQPPQTWHLWPHNDIIADDEVRR